MSLCFLSGPPRTSATKYFASSLLGRMETQSAVKIASTGPLLGIPGNRIGFSTKTITPVEFHPACKGFKSSSLLIKPTYSLLGILRRNSSDLKEILLFSETRMAAAQNFLQMSTSQGNAGS